MIYTPGPHSTDLNKHFEGKPRLEARICEGGKYELGWGSTYLPDGRDVTSDMTCTHQQAEIYFQHCGKQESGPVWSTLTFTPNQFQIDALASMAYNVGGSAVASTLSERSSSAIIRHMNAGRWEDAAAGMSVWTGATSSGPSKKQRESGAYDDIIMFADGQWKWKGQDGQPCLYFQRLRGLLRRRLAEGLLSLGLQWREACSNNAVHLRARRKWVKGMWRDQIISQTSFRDVLQVARGNKLESLAPIDLSDLHFRAQDDDLFEPDLELPAISMRAENPAPVEVIEPVIEDFTQENVEAPVTPPPPEPFQDYDPAAPPKPLPTSKRFWGYFTIFFSLIASGFEQFAGLVAQLPFTQELANMSPLKEGNDWMKIAILIAGMLLLWYGQVRAKGPIK